LQQGRRVQEICLYIYATICGWMPGAGCKWKAKLARQTIFDWWDGTPRILQYTYYYTMYIQISCYYIQIMYLCIYIYIYISAGIEFQTSPLNRPPSTILKYIQDDSLARPYFNNNQFIKILICLIFIPYIFKEFLLWYQLLFFKLKLSFSINC
jgi:hypothetical protein